MQSMTHPPGSIEGTGASHSLLQVEAPSLLSPKLNKRTVKQEKPTKVQYARNDSVPTILKFYHFFCVDLSESP